MFFGVGAEHVGDMQNEPSSFQSGARRLGADDDVAAIRPAGLHDL